MAAPSLSNPAAMATTTVASSLQVTLQDGSTRTLIDIMRGLVRWGTTEVGAPA